MRRFILILIAFAAFAISYGQEKTVSKTFTNSRSYYIYTGASTDILDGATYDTITVDIFLDKGQPIQAYSKSTFSLVGTADTTFSCAMYGKVFAADEYTLIDSTVRYGTADTSAVLKTTSKPYARLDSLDSNTDDLYLYDYLFYRYLRFRYVIVGNDATGSGIKLESIEIKIPE